MIGTVFKSQRQLLDAISTLYLRGGTFEIDVTYGSGAMHRGRLRPERCFDIKPRDLLVERADCRDLPIDSGTVSSIIFDPPFLAGGGVNSVMHAKYSSFKKMADLFDFYGEALVEAHRVLKKGGLIAFKCQDLNNGRTQGFSHCEIYRQAKQAGFYALDLFVLTSENRMKPYGMKTQAHARKTHCYFWVFKKSSRRNHGDNISTDGPAEKNRPSCEG